ncbi:hypothetical protein [Chromobacterium amazonense]|uniref:DUF3304 domain-containing protein n=1 Tax=Chromobacterium amazonense TaxID=1382803 RepID=A0ABU8V6T2_9NEIS|nr:hypothetical protein [Chromobacterium amazonense]MDQ4541206.1 hypothetical protein [Chromobacterium amazonense]
MKNDSMTRFRDIRPYPKRPSWLARLSTRTQWMIVGLLMMLLAGAYWAWYEYGPDERVFSTRTWNYNQRAIAEVRVDGRSGGNAMPIEEGYLAGGGGIVVGQMIDVNKPLVVEWQMEYSSVAAMDAGEVPKAYRAVLPPLREDPGIPADASTLVLHFYPDHVEADFEQEGEVKNGKYVGPGEVKPRPPRGDGGKAQPIQPFMR